MGEQLPQSARRRRARAEVAERYAAIRAERDRLHLLVARKRAERARVVAWAGKEQRRAAAAQERSREILDRLPPSGDARW